MDCYDVQNLIPPYCRGELDDDTTRRIEEHLTGCRDCSGKADDDRALGRLIDGGSVEDPPEDYWDDYNANIRSRVKGAASLLQRLGCLSLLWAFPAGLAIGFVIISVLLLLPDYPYLRFALAGVLGGAAAWLFGRFIARELMTPRGLRGYERDEGRLRRFIAENPLWRNTFMIIFMAVGLASSIFVAGIYFCLIGQWLPAWLRYPGAIIVFAGLLATLPEYYAYLSDYLDNRHRPLTEYKSRLTWWSARIVSAAVVGSCAWMIYILLISCAQDLPLPPR